MKKLFSILLTGFLVIGSVGTTQAFWSNTLRTARQKLVPQAFSQTARNFTTIKNYVMPHALKAMNCARANWKKWYFWKNTVEYAGMGGWSLFKYVTPFYALSKAKNSITYCDVKKAHVQGTENLKEFGKWMLDHTVVEPLEYATIGLATKITSMPKMPNKTCTQLRKAKDPKEINKFQEKNNSTLRFWSAGVPTL